jgi:hypothetical protein
VRLDKDLLEGLKLAGIVRSPQHALNLYEKSYLELIELKVKINSEPDRKDEIQKERETESKHEIDNPLDIEDCEPETPKKPTMRERIELEKLNLNNKK